ncbi:MAG: FAD-dependent oxidoreductase [Pseudomonadota bacterium]
MHTIVVGAGIVGLSAAYALRKRQVDVTLVERGAIPYHLASSSDHHRLIRSLYGEDAGYCARMGDAYAAWHAMWRDLRQPSERYFADTGTLAVCREPGDYTDLSRETMERLGLPFERIDDPGEIAKRFPFVEVDGIAYAVMSDGGALRADRVMIDLVEWLRENGTAVREHSPVASVDVFAGRVTLASGEILEADRVLVCAGVETAKLVPDVSVPLAPVRSIIAYVEPPADIQQAWTNAPCWADLGGDTILWGMPAIEGLPMKLGNGALGSTDPDDSNRTVTPAEAQALLNGYVGHFKGADRFRILWAQANYWTLAPRSTFFLEQIDRVLVVSACSGHGFKFGALTGQDMADAITGKDSVETIAARLAG